MEPADLLITPRWLLPIAPANVALEGHAVAVTAGRIVAVGPVAQLQARFAAQEHVSRDSHVLLPGFVNAHTRASLALTRDMRLAMPVSRWVIESKTPLITPDFVRDATQLAIAEMLQAGITAFGDWDWYPEAAARAAAEARVRAVIGLPVYDSETFWAPDLATHLERAAHLWDEHRADPWVSTYFAPPSQRYLSDAALGRLRSVADELDARVAMTVNETASLVQDALSQHHLRPLQRLAKLGLLSPGFTAIHMNAVDASDIALAQDSGLSVVACPHDVKRAPTEVCPASALLAAGVAVGFGSSQPPFGGPFDVLAEARLAHELADLPSMDPADALKAATLGGAVALGIAADCGSIEPGKAADLICIDLSSLACRSYASIEKAVLLAATRRDVTDVWTGGRAAVTDSQLLAFDAAELARMARRWADEAQSGALT
jgi:5-methylthioadenosine/S-adenosylhomocysteine deaminase